MRLHKMKISTIDKHFLMGCPKQDIKDFVQGVNNVVVVVCLFLLFGCCGGFVDFFVFFF